LYKNHAIHEHVAVMTVSWLHVWVDRIQFITKLLMETVSTYKYAIHLFNHTKQPVS